MRVMILKGCGFFCLQLEASCLQWSFVTHIVLQLTILAFLLTLGLAYSFSFFTCNCSFFAYNGKVRLIRALRDCEQRSLTESKKAPTVSKKASPILKRMVH